MNQILMTEPYKNKKEKKQKVREFRTEEQSIRSIIKFFAFAIILLGLCFTGNGAYAIYQEIEHTNSIDYPQVSSTQKGGLLTLKIQNNVGIKTIKYSLNGGTESILQGRGQRSIESQITLKEGNNRLEVSVIDNKNDQTNWIKNYILEEKAAPVIRITSEDPKIKITVTSETELDYIIYKYGDSSEIKISASQSSPYKIEAYIDNVLEIEQLLVVEAVDKDGYTSTEQQRVKGTTKPVIELTPSQTKAGVVNVKIKDNTELQMVVVYINGEEKLKTNPDKPIKEQPEYMSDGKEFNFGITVSKGVTEIKINAYNVDGQVTEYSNTIRY